MKYTFANRFAIEDELQLSCGENPRGHCGGLCRKHKRQCGVNVDGYATVRPGSWRAASRGYTCADSDARARARPLMSQLSRMFHPQDTGLTHASHAGSSFSSTAYQSMFLPAGKPKSIFLLSRAFARSGKLILVAR